MLLNGILGPVAADPWHLLAEVLDCPAEGRECPEVNVMEDDCFCIQEEDR